MSVTVFFTNFYQNIYLTGFIVKMIKTNFSIGYDKIETRRKIKNYLRRTTKLYQRGTFGRYWWCTWTIFRTQLAGRFAFFGPDFESYHNKNIRCFCSYKGCSQCHKDQLKIIILFKECLRPAKKYRISHHKIVESDESAAKISLVIKDKIGIATQKFTSQQLLEV